MLITLSVTFVLLVLCDQLSKSAIVSSLVNIGASSEFIPGILRFEYYRNTGMAWGLFPGASWFFVILTLLLGGFIIFLVIKYRRTMPKLLQFALTLVLSGAVGNLIDRVFLGYVRDFIMFDFFSFPAFNIADSCISIGAVLIAISVLLTKKGRDFFGSIGVPDGTKRGKDCGSDGIGCNQSPDAPLNGEENRDSIGRNDG